MCQIWHGNDALFIPSSFRHVLVNWFWDDNDDGGIYEGRSINKLQNFIILLIFKIWQFWNIGFVRNLIGHICWNFFYEDDFIIVTLRVHRTQSVSAVFCPFFITCQVLNTIMSYVYQKK